jgi:hypothetical protein
MRAGDCFDMSRPMDHGREQEAWLTSLGGSPGTRRFSTRAHNPTTVGSRDGDSLVMSHLDLNRLISALLSLPPNVLPMCPYWEEWVLDGSGQDAHAELRA